MDVKGPDGVITRFPDGTPDAKINEVMSGIYAKPKAAAGPSYSAADLVASKFTMGLSDKAAAAGTAGGSYLRSLITGKPGVSYDDALAGERRSKERYVASNPGVDWATLPANLLGGGAAATGIRNVGRAAVAAGGISGGAAALGGDNPTALSVMGGSIAGGAIGKGASVAVPAVVRAANKAGAPIAAKAGQMMASRSGSVPAPPISVSTVASRRPAPSPAQRMIADALEADGLTPRQAAQRIEEARKRGVPLTLSDIGDNARGLATGVATAPGASRKIMRDSVIARQQGQTERVQSAINRDLGPTTGVATEAQRLEGQAAARAKPLYDEAYASGPIVDDMLGRLAAHPEMVKALEAGRQIHADDVFIAGIKGEAPPASLPEGGMDVRTLDYVKRALDRKIDAAYSGDSAAKMQLPILKQLRETMLGRLDDVSPSYKAARAAYAGPMKSSEALQAGRAAINKTADDIAADTSKMTDSELDQFKLGLRSALSDKLEGQTDGGAKANALVGTPKKRKVLSAMFGGEDGFDNFMATVAAEAETSVTYGRIAGGSPTSRNLADDRNVAEGSGVVESVAKAGAKTLLGSPIDALRGLIGDANERIASKAGESVRAELAAALSEADPVVLAEALRQANRFRAQSRLDVRRARPVAAASSGYAGRIAGGGGPAMGTDQ